jgi:hypothetical protein
MFDQNQSPPVETEFYHRKDAETPLMVPDSVEAVG